MAEPVSYIWSLVFCDGDDPAVGREARGGFEDFVCELEEFVLDKAKAEEEGAEDEEENKGEEECLDAAGEFVQVRYLGKVGVKFRDEVVKGCGEECEVEDACAEGGEENADGALDDD